MKGSFVNLCLVMFIICAITCLLLVIPKYFVPCYNISFIFCWNIWWFVVDIFCYLTTILMEYVVILYIHCICFTHKNLSKRLWMVYNALLLFALWYWQLNLLKPPHSIVSLYYLYLISRLTWYLDFYLLKIGIRHLIEALSYRWTTNP